MGIHAWMRRLVKVVWILHLTSLTIVTEHSTRHFATLQCIGEMKKLISSVTTATSEDIYFNVDRVTKEFNSFIQIYCLSSYLIINGIILEIISHRSDINNPYKRGIYI